MNAEGFSSSSKHNTQPIVLFVGDTTSFSNMYIRLLQSEFPDVHFESVASITEARNARAHNGGKIRAIVLSCRSGLDDVAELEIDVEKEPGLRPVLAYQTAQEARTALQAIKNRAFVERLSFLPLRSRMDCTVTILRLVLSGERHVSGDVLDMLMTWKSENQKDNEGWTLTAREKQVLAKLAKGAPNKVIARDLRLAESTVKLHIHHIIGKLGVSNRTEAAVAYVGSLAKTQNAT